MRWIYTPLNGIGYNGIIKIRNIIKNLGYDEHFSNPDQENTYLELEYIKSKYEFLYFTINNNKANLINPHYPYGYSNKLYDEWDEFIEVVDFKEFINELEKYLSIGK